MPISVIQRTRAIRLPLVIYALKIVRRRPALSIVACGGVKSRQTCKYLSLDHTLNKNGPGMPTRARAVL
jgi:hypothetical protein